MKQRMDIPPRTTEIGGLESQTLLYTGKLPHGHVYLSLYIVRCMMLIIERLCLSHIQSTGLSYNKKLGTVYHYPMKLEKLLWPFKHWYRSTPHNNHQLVCGLSPPACRCATSLPWFRSSSLVCQCLKSELAAFDNVMCYTFLQELWRKDKCFDYSWRLHWKK